MWKKNGDKACGDYLFITCSPDQSVLLHFILCSPKYPQGIYMPCPYHHGSTLLILIPVMMLITAWSCFHFLLESTLFCPQSVPFNILVLKQLCLLSHTRYLHLSESVKRGKEGKNLCEKNIAAHYEGILHVGFINMQCREIQDKSLHNMNTLGFIYVCIMYSVISHCRPTSIIETTKNSPSTVIV